MTHPQAVCLLAMKVDGKTLCISRRNDTTQWGLPGGKVDPGETPLHAVVRETFEETGIVLKESKLIELYRADCPGDVTYDTITYFYDEAAPELEDLAAEAGLTLAYQDIEFLTTPENSPFAGYNLGVVHALAMKFVGDVRTAADL